MSATIQGVEVSWERVPELFRLDPAVSHLNHGAYGAVPVPVQLAQQRLRDEIEANPRAFFVRGLMDRIGHVRRHIAAFLGADPDGTALLPNATAGIAVVLGPCGSTPGAEILLTDHGLRRGAARRPAAAAPAPGWCIREVDVPLAAPDDEVVDRILAAVRPGRTRLVVCRPRHVADRSAHAGGPAGRGAAGAGTCPLLVDGAHAPGHAAGRRRGDRRRLLGGQPAQVGVHAARRPRSSSSPRRTGDHIEPLVVSWEQPAGFPAAVEYGGTLDYTPWLAAPAGLHFLRTLGPDRVRRHNIDLADYAQLTVAAAVRADPAELVRSEPVTMRIVPLPAGVADTRDAATLRDRLATEHGCEVAVNAWRGRGHLRISAQVYNVKADVDRLAEACAAVLRP